MAIETIQARTLAAVPAGRNEDSGSSPDPVPRALAYKTTDAAESLDRPAYKSEAVAYAWSILGTAVPVLAGSLIPGNNKMEGVLIVGGLLLGPSSGQFYAGSLRGGIVGAGIRTGGAFTTLLGMAYLFSDGFCMNSEGDCGGNEEAIAVPVIILGIGAYLGGTIYSLMDAGRAVGRQNARQNDARVFGWSPTVAPTPDGGLRTGAAAYLRF